jgi:hypothetical protein
VEDANFNTPTASPFFQYNFRRKGDVVQAGFTVEPSAPPPPAPSYPGEAPMK